MAKYMYQRQEIIDILPNEFMLSIGAHRDNHYMCRKQPGNPGIVEAQSISEYNHRRWEDTAIVKCESIAAWLNNGDLINSMNIEEYMSSVLLSNVTLDDSAVDVLL